MKIAVIDKDKCNNCLGAMPDGVYESHCDNACAHGCVDSAEVYDIPVINDCNGCGDCIDVCPNNAITLQDQNISVKEEGRRRETKKEERTREEGKHYIKPTVT